MLKRIVWGGEEGGRGGGKCRCVGPDEAEQKGVGVDRERERLQRAIT